MVVGGQAATHWLRVSGSRDVDFVAPNFSALKGVLLAAGFREVDASFRLKHDGPVVTASVLVELVGETIEVAGVRSDEAAVTTIRPADVETPQIRALMEGDALVLDPCLVFLNYAEASSPDSVWHDFDDDGGLALDRATVLLDLYRCYIVKRLGDLHAQSRLPERLAAILRDRFGLELG